MQIQSNFHYLKQSPVPTNFPLGWPIETFFYRVVSLEICLANLGEDWWTTEITWCRGWLRGVGEVQEVVQSDKTITKCCFHDFYRYHEGVLKSR